jgi:thermitase
MSPRGRNFQEEKKMARKYSPLLRARILAVVAIALMATWVFGADVPTDAPAARILVKFRPGANASEVARLHAANNAVVTSVISGIRVTRLHVPPGQEQAAVEDYRRSPSVEFAEIDSLVETQFTPNDPYYTLAYQTTRYGNIPQWAPQFVSASEAWDITQGDPAIIIAIVDTGIDTQHPELQGKIVGGTSFVGRSVKDQHGHGTHVAGIAAGSTNNSTGIAGICPRCSIMPIRALDASGSGYLSDVAAGIVYAADNGARIINLSLGGPSKTQTLRAAIDYAFAHNALPVAAMGNGYAPEALEPAYWYSALSVGAVDQSGAKADFSNYGPKTDVVAPGVAILSTLPTYQVTLTQTYELGYDALSGTSMATPVVSGIAGLVLSRNPALSASQVKGIIEATAGDGKSFTDTTGFGLVNAARAVGAAVNTDFARPTVNLISPAQGSTVSKLVTVQAAPMDDTLVHHIDLIRDGTRFIPPLTGVTTTNGSGKNAVTTQPWTIFWPSTLVFNGLVSATALATDSFGNTSAPQDVAFTIQNQLVSQNLTVHVCFPSTPSCPNVSPWVPVTTPVATEAATHLQGTVTYTGQALRYPNFYVQIANGKTFYYCGTAGTTVDCYPLTTMLPTTSGRSGSVVSPNYVAGQINAVTTKQGGSTEADINITLTYPQ